MSNLADMPSAPNRDHHADLVEAIAAHRDKAAFAELFSYFAPRVKAYLIRQGAPADQAEELAQDVMITLWRKADMFDRSQASVSTWVFRIARNRRIDAYRRENKPELDPYEPTLAPPDAVRQDEAVTALERDEAVRLAMADLPTEQLDLLRLAFFDGLTHREIADKTDLPLGTVKSRMRLAFQKLRSRLDGD